MDKTLRTIYICAGVFLLVVCLVGGLGRVFTSDQISSLPLVLFLFGLYFVPSIVGRHKRNRTAIMALNVFLGWTLIGWVIALVWALTVDAPETKETV